jgi:hypothetical protein
MDAQQTVSESSSSAEGPVECVIALVQPDGRWEPVCEMFRVDHRTMTWSSKHYSSGTCFTDGGRLRRGETAKALALTGTGSSRFRYPRQTCVTFVLASIDERLFDTTRPTDWTVERLAQLPGARVATFGG